MKKLLFITILGLTLSCSKKKKEEEACERVKEQKIELKASHQKQVDGLTSSYSKGLLAYSDYQRRIDVENEKYERNLEALNSQCIYTKYD